ncbi:MAG: hypothetical protein JNM99_00680 [Verrucomicrobiaceae bacterium]|nr:hypothetical protein [Verrucomicrobiaceae bacterium]
MKPVPNILLSLLLIALCGLCGWQWHRETQLRALAASQREAIEVLTAKRDDLDTRVKAADAEVLRLTQALAELRANSVSKDIHAEIVETNTKLRDAITKQNAAITQQNELIAKQNAAIQIANDNLKKLATERDDLAKRLNDVTAMYNKLVKQE